jgi:hypothetical protein
MLEPIVFPLLFDEVRDNFGVGFRDELVALRLQLAFQLQVVFDDAVVNDDDLALAVAVWMRVLFSRPAVRRPSCVAEAVEAGQRIAGDDVLEVGQLAGTAPDVETVAVDDRDARGVVAPVFKPPQALDEDRHDRFVADVTDDAAHRE